VTDRTNIPYPVPTQDKRYLSTLVRLIPTSPSPPSPVSSLFLFPSWSSKLVEFRYRRSRALTAEPHAQSRLDASTVLQPLHIPYKTKTSVRHGQTKTRTDTRHHWHPLVRHWYGLLTPDIAVHHPGTRNNKYSSHLSGGCFRLDRSHRATRPPRHSASPCAHTNRARPSYISSSKAGCFFSPPSRRACWSSCWSASCRLRRLPPSQSTLTTL